ncbi:MAG: DUF4389 domain-containing protein [Pseudomonadales bacterium]|nr:DUF4389 domain-containing protein [Pseudomonadales bacterium]
MSDDIVQNLKQIPQWQRIVFMLGFIVVLYIAATVLLVITLAQALFSLLTGKDNENLRALGAALASYVHAILMFLTYNSDHKPFPFSPFPFNDDNAATAARPDTVEPVNSSPTEPARRKRSTGTTTRKRTTTRKTAAAKSVKAAGKKAAEKKASNSQNEKISGNAAEQATEKVVEKTPDKEAD